MAGDMQLEVLADRVAQRAQEKALQTAKAAPVAAKPAPVVAKVQPAPDGRSLWEGLKALIDGFGQSSSINGRMLGHRGCSGCKF